MRNALIAAAFAAPLLLLPPTPSVAQDIDVDIGIGRPGVYVDEDYTYRRRRGRVDCREARQILRDRGYYRITTLDCGGPVHRFRASRRGNRFMVSVSRRGAVWRE